MILLPIALALAVPPAFAAAAAAPRPTPIDPAAWVGMDDYPAPAMRAMEEGRVAFRLAVDARGVVTACLVTASSGSALLDVHTCDLMRLRAQFRPATRDGVAVAGEYSSAVTWRIPQGVPADVTAIYPASRSVVTLAVGTDGRVARCTVVEATGAAAADAGLDPCHDYPAGSRYADPVVRDGRPVSGEVRISHSVEATYDR